MEDNKTLDWTNGSLGVDYPSLEVVEQPFQMALVLLFSLTATISLGGNLTVIAILSLGKRSSGDLKAFLINLAISDVTMAVFSIPFTYTLFMLGRWIFAPWFCPVAMAMQQLSVIVSVYTLMAIGIDRYKAIMYPFDRRLRKCRNKVIIAGIWVMAGLISAVQLGVSSSKQFKYGGEWHYDCIERWDSVGNGRLYTVFIFLFTFAIPLLGLGCTYTAIAWKMWRRSSPGNADPERDLVQLRAKRKVIKMLVTIVVVFSLCWLPLQIFNLVYYFVPGFEVFYTDTSRRLYALSFFACLWLANANSFVNPLIYCFMSENFRADLVDLVRRLRGKQTTPRSFRSSVRSGSTRTTICLAQHNSEFSRSFRNKRVSYDFDKRPADSSDYRRTSLAHSFL